MKKYLIIYFLTSLAIIYPMFAFTFYSFNPSDWSAIGRFAYCILSIVLFLSLAALYWEEAQQIEEINRSLERTEEALKNFSQSQKEKA